MSPPFKYRIEDCYATWLELFFDLVFISDIRVITHHLVHVTCKAFTPTTIFSAPS